jgi:RNA polymerase subunit RPABC4/transcription elongation factor Spt4
MPFCPNCGKEVSEDMEFCPECGEKLEETKKLAGSSEVAKGTTSEEADAVGLEFIVPSMGASVFFMAFVLATGDLGGGVALSLWAWVVLFPIFLGVQKLLVKKGVRRQLKLKRATMHKLLGLMGIVIVIGLMAGVAGHYENQLDYYAQRWFHTNWGDLSSKQQNGLSEIFSEVAIIAQRKEWYTSWVIRPALIFAFLTAAIVTSGLILRKVFPGISKRGVVTPPRDSEK